MEGTRGVLQTTHQDLQEKEEGRYSMNVSPQEGVNGKKKYNFIFLSSYGLSFMETKEKDPVFLNSVTVKVPNTN